MAVQKLKIIVVSGSGNGNRKSGGDDKTVPTAKGKKSTLYKVLNYNDTIKNKIRQVTTPTQFFAIQQGVGLATQTARQAVNYYISDIGRRNGDSNYQAIVDRRIEQVTDALSIGQGALGGAAAGAAIGPLGAVIGAAIGAAGSGITLGFKYAERERAYQHEIFQENNSQAYNLARANYTAMTGRVR